MFSSIRVRLSLSHLAVIVLAMGLSAFLLLSFLEDYFMEATRDSLEAQARITAQALIPGTIPEESSTGTPSEDIYRNSAANTIQQQQVSSLSLQAENFAPPDDIFSLGNADLTYLADASLQLSAQMETRIRIMDIHGTVLVDSEQEGQGANLHDDPLISRALAGEIASRTEENGGDTMHLALSANIGDQPAGVVYLSQPLRDVTAVLHDLRNRMFIAAGIALALSAIVALLLSRAISNPVRHLTVAARAVAQGELDQQVPARSNDEIGQLSRTFNDMTTRLKSARQMQTDFVANVSHESRTPLTAIKGMVETLNDGAVDEPETRDRFLKTIESETDRLIRLVNDLLLLSRADSEALNLNREPVDLNRLIRTVTDQLAPQVEAKRLILKSEDNPNLPLAIVDPDRVKQVMVNILDNAIKYSRPGGTISFAMVSGDGSILIQVSDEGIGMSSQELSRIGERFYRTDEARSRAEGGTGLGLAIAKALVEAHGGQLNIESVEGQGTTVIFTLPCT